MPPSSSFLSTRFMVLPFFFTASRLVNLNNTKLPEEAVFIGRPSPWGNPYTLSKYSRAEAIELFEQHLFASGLINNLHLLKFKCLASFCYPEPCHGMVLLKYLEILEKDGDS